MKIKIKKIFRFKEMGKAGVNKRQGSWLANIVMSL